MDDPQLTLTETHDDAAHVVSARGEIHLSTAPQLAEFLGAAIEEGRVRIVLDLTEVEFIDSTGLSVLLNVLRQLNPLYGRLVLVCTNPTVLRLFEITHLDATFEIVATRAEALVRIQDRATDSSAGAP